MPLFDFQNFMGMFPKLDRDKLPPGAGVLVKDANLHGGSLKPLAIGTPIQSFHDGTKMKTGILATDLVALAAPGKVTLNKLTPKCLPFLPTPGNLLVAPEWMKISAAAFGVYTSGTDAQAPQFVGITGQGGIPGLTVSIDRCENIDTGLRLYITLGSSNILCVPLESWYFYGPRWQFTLHNDPNGQGGPNLGTGISLVLPTYLSYTDPVLPAWSVPLWDNGQVYATLKVRDISGPLWDKEDVIFPTQSTPYFFTGGQVIIEMGLEWTDPRRRYWRFVQTLKDVNGNESPASDPSDIITVGPGDTLTINTPTSPGTWPAAGMKRLWQAGKGAGDKFLLLDEVKTEEATWTDAGQVPRPDVLPDDLGLWTECGITVGNQADFLENCLLHPGKFLVAMVNRGGTPAKVELWFSAPDHWGSWDKKRVQGFHGTGLAIALVGETVLLFLSTTGTGGEEDGRIWALSGSSPIGMQPYILSDAYPLQNKLSIFRLPGMVGWVSPDGLVWSQGNSVTNLTQEFYDRSGWQSLIPATLSCRTAGAAILIEGTGENATKLMFEPVSEFLVEFTSVTGSADPVWKSGRLVLPQPQILDHVVVNATAGIKLTITTTADDGTETTTEFSLTFADCNSPYALGGLGPARLWQVKAELLSTSEADALKGMTFYERQIVEVPAGGVDLTLSGSMLWQDIYLKFKDLGRFVAGSVDVGDGSDVILSFLERNGGNLFQIHATDGRAFQIRDENNLPQELVRLRLNGIKNSVLLPLTAPVVSVKLRTRTVREVGRGITRIARNEEDQIPEWWTTRYKASPDRMPLQNIRVNHRVNTDGTPESVTLTIRDQSDTEYQIGGLMTGVEKRIDPVLFLSWFTLDFGGDTDDALVDEIIMGTDDVRAASGGVVVDGTGFLKGSTFKFQEASELAAIRALATGYGDTGVGVTFHVDNEPLAKIVSDPSTTLMTLADGYWKGLPRGWGRHYLWDLDVSLPTRAGAVAGRVISVEALARRFEKLSPEGTGEVAHQDGCPTWLMKRWTAAVPFEPVSAIVRLLPGASFDGMSMMLYLDAAAAASGTVAVPGEWEFLLPTVGTTCRQLELDFNGRDHEVYSWEIFGRVPIKIEPNGIVLRKADGIHNWLDRTLEFARTGSFTGLRVVADDYTGMVVSLKVAGGATLWQAPTSVGGTMTVEPITDGNERALPPNLPDAKSWRVSVSYRGRPPSEVHLYGRVAHDLQHGVFHVTQAQQPLSFNGMRVRAGRPDRFTCGRIQAEPAAYPIRVSLRSGGVERAARTVENERPFTMILYRPVQITDIDWIPAVSGAQIYEGTMAISNQLMNI